MLTAFQRVEDAVSATEILRQEHEKQDHAVAAAQRTLSEAKTRYAAALDPYLNVLETQQTVLTYQQTAVLLQSQQASATVQLIQSLGGGWDVSELPSPREIARMHSK